MLFISRHRFHKMYHENSVVSISESRCFSFQVCADDTVRLNHNSFQSRNRDAFHFKNAFRGTGMKPLSFVSISESRCFSFQERITSDSRDGSLQVSISESRCFSFQARALLCRHHSRMYVSISESRCFSFQVNSPLRRPHFR